MQCKTFEPFLTVCKTLEAFVVRSESPLPRCAARAAAHPAGRAAAGHGAAPAAHSTGHGRLPPADAARPAAEGRSTYTVVGASAVYSTTSSNKKGLAHSLVSTNVLYL